MSKIILTAAQQQSFLTAIKKGIYKEMHHQNLLQDEQLNALLNQLYLSQNNTRKQNLPCHRQ